jgi:hypothetical protein
MKLLDEAGLARVEKHWRTNGFSALTAWRADESDASNRSALTKLKALVAVARYGWMPVMGSWSEAGGKAVYEPSLLIPALRRDSPRDEVSMAKDSRDLRKFVIDWGVKFGQWSVLFVRPDGKAENITTNPRLSGHPNGFVADTFKAFVPGDTSADIRTILSRAAHRRIARGKDPVSQGDPGKTFHFEAFLDRTVPALPTEALTRRSLGELGISPLWEDG